ncbi:hypothetical protein D3C75_1035800 [compost metagenome]
MPGTERGDQLLARIAPVHAKIQRLGRAARQVTEQQNAVMAMADADQRTAATQGLADTQFDRLGGAAQDTLAVGIEGQLRGVFVAGVDGAIDFVMQVRQGLFQRADAIEALQLQAGDHFGGVVAVTGGEAEALERLAADHLDFIERDAHISVLRQRWPVSASPRNSSHRRKAGQSH